ncbi:MAG: hypothetical protein ACXWUN_08660 [Allosphingosinicella sp.]
MPAIAQSTAAPLNAGARASATLGGASAFQDDDDDDGGSTAVLLGLVLVILMAMVFVSDSGNEPNNPPISP